MYRIAICDDDTIYVDYLEELIRREINSLEKIVMYKYYSGEDFLKDIHIEFDLVFLDMQMSKVDGITAALNLRKYNQDAILVFCTGVQLPKPEFFDVQPFRYLMKSYNEAKHNQEIRNIIKKMTDVKKASYIYVCNDGKVDKICIDDITYISNLKRGCCIHIFSRKNGQCYEIISNKKLNETYLELEKHFFEFAHNSYIVNFKAIIGVKNDLITLEDLTTLNVSRSKKSNFHLKFAEYLGEKYKRSR